MRFYGTHEFDNIIAKNSRIRTLKVNDILTLPYYSIDATEGIYFAGDKIVFINSEREPKTLANKSDLLQLEVLEFLHKLESSFDVNYFMNNLINYDYKYFGYNDTTILLDSLIKYSDTTGVLTVQFNSRVNNAYNSRLLSIVNNFDRSLYAIRIKFTDGVENIILDTTNQNAGVLDSTTIRFICNFVVNHANLLNRLLDTTVNAYDIQLQFVDSANVLQNTIENNVYLIDEILHEKDFVKIDENTKQIHIKYPQTKIYKNTSDLFVYDNTIHFAYNSEFNFKQIYLETKSVENTIKFVNFDYNYVILDDTHTAQHIAEVSVNAAFIYGNALCEIRNLKFTINIDENQLRYYNLFLEFSEIDNTQTPKLEITTFVPTDEPIVKYTIHNNRLKIALLIMKHDFFDATNAYNLILVYKPPLNISIKQINELQPYYMLNKPFFIEKNNVIKLLTDSTETNIVIERLNENPGFIYDLSRIYGFDRIILNHENNTITNITGVFRVIDSSVINANDKILIM